MNLTKRYNELYRSSTGKIKNGDYHTDLLIDAINDRRFGIALLIRPPENNNEKIQLFLDELKQVDPLQYYYPNSDIHITVMAIIPCYEGFQLDQVAIPGYIDLIQESLKDIDRFRIKLKGITASDAGIMIQGFPENDLLNKLRNKLRTKFKNSDLEQSIDKRYVIQTAHATVMRFKRKLQDKNDLLAILERNRNSCFGSFEVKELELVYNDWYLREGKSKLLKKFSL